MRSASEEQSEAAAHVHLAGSLRGLDAAQPPPAASRSGTEPTQTLERPRVAVRRVPPDGPVQRQSNEEEAEHFHGRSMRGPRPRRRLCSEPAVNDAPVPIVRTTSGPFAVPRSFRFSNTRANRLIRAIEAPVRSLRSWHLPAVQEAHPPVAIKRRGQRELR